MLDARKLAAAMVYGSGKATSEGRAEKKANEQETAAANTKITINGDGSLDIKGATPEMLQGREQQALAETRDAPLIEARRVAAEMGFPVKDASPDAVRRDLSSFRGSYREARKVGAKPIWAAVAGIAGARGKPLVGLQEDVAYARAKETMDAYRASKPVLAEERAEQSAQANAAKARRTAVLAAIDKGDLTNLTPEFVAARAGLDPTELGEDDLRSIEARRRSLSAKDARDRRGRVARVINDLDADALTPENVAKLAEVDDLAPEEVSSLSARRKALEDKARRDEDRDLRAERREIRAAAAEARAAAAAERAEASAARGERREQATLKRQEAEAKTKQIDKVVADMEETYEQMQANSRTFAKSEDADERAELQRQNAALRVAQTKQREALDALLGKKAAPKSEAGAVEYVNEREWKALLATGETAASLAKQGIRLKR